MADPIVQYIEARWPILPAIALLWLFPLTAGIAVDKLRSVPGRLLWNARDRARIAVPVLHLRRTLTVGCITGVAAVIAMMGLRAGIHAWVAPGQRNLEEFTLAFYYWNIYLSLIAQTLAAILTAVLCPHSRVIHSLAAAFVAGVFAGFALIFGQTVGSCLTLFSIHPGAQCPAFADTTFMRLVFEQTLIKGSLLAIAAGLVVVGVVAAHRQVMHRKHLRPTSRVTRLLERT